VCAGSNPAGGTLYEVPKDPVTSGNAEAGVFAYVSRVPQRGRIASGGYPVCQWCAGGWVTDRS
jgi:hypothetical protein